MSFVKKGFAVVLDTRHSGNDVKSFRDQDQQWKFNKFGKIYFLELSQNPTFMLNWMSSLGVFLNITNGIFKYTIIRKSPLMRYKLQIY